LIAIGLETAFFETFSFLLFFSLLLPDLCGDPEEEDKAEEEDKVEEEEEVEDVYPVLCLGVLTPEALEN